MAVVTIVVLQLVLVISIVNWRDTCALQVRTDDINFDRRRLLLQKIPAIVGGGTSAIGYHPPVVAYNNIKNNKNNNRDIYQVFQVIPDASPALNPSLNPVMSNSFIETVSKNGGTLWLGEHHNSQSDHLLQCEILQQIHEHRSENNKNNNNNKLDNSLVGKQITTAIGLEQVQIQFQSVLDDYIAGTISISQLRKRIEWDKRWVWSFDLYEPIFILAQKLQMPLIALNVNSEDLALVERYGLPGLSKDRLREYVVDPPGFASFVTRKQYSAYNDYVLRPSYEIHRQMGLLQYSIDGMKLDQEMSYRNFFSGRILWDESMASNAYRWIVKNPGALLIGLVGADHVKFYNGIPGRYSRYSSDNRGICVSVMLNPTLIDTRPYGTVVNTPKSMSSNYPDEITLQLRYLKDNFATTSTDLDGDTTRNHSTIINDPESTGGVLPLADYLVIG